MIERMVTRNGPVANPHLRTLNRPGDYAGVMKLADL